MTLSQDLLVTPPFPVSVKVSMACIPENPSLACFPSVTPFAYTSHNVHYHYHPTFAELDLMDFNTIQYICYTASLSIANNSTHENLLGESNIRDLEAWALNALPLC